MIRRLILFGTLGMLCHLGIASAQKKPQVLPPVLPPSVLPSAEATPHTECAGYSEADPAPTAFGLPRWLQIRRHAIPSDTGHYIGYYVGGGCACYRKAELPTPDEGTWGWDYQGWLIPRRVALSWWHGRRYQGGIGSYRTDGPHLTKLPQ